MPLLSNRNKETGVKKMNKPLWIGMRLLALLMIVYSVVMLGRMALLTLRGTSTFIPEVEDLRPTREALETSGESLSPVPDGSGQVSEAPFLGTEGIEDQAVPLAEAPRAALDEEAGAIPAHAEAVQAAKDGFNLAALREINPDISGWLILDGTGIDFPILQDNAAHNAYLATGSVPWTEGTSRLESLYKYLYYDYLGSPSALGSVTVDYRYGLEDQYVLLYAHNAGQDGVMFSDLSRMLEEDYCAAHHTGALYTESGSHELELVAVAAIDGYTQAVYGEVTDLADAVDYVVRNGVYTGPGAEGLSAIAGGRVIVLSTCLQAGHPEDPTRITVVYRVGD